MSELQKPSNEAWFRWKMGASEFVCLDERGVTVGLVSKPGLETWDELKTILERYGIIEMIEQARDD